jgi:hypothetical protein
MLHALPSPAVAIASRPMPVSCRQAAVLGGRIYVAGGMDEGRTRSAAVWALDPRDGRRGWAPAAPLAAPRSSAGLAALQVKEGRDGGREEVARERSMLCESCVAVGRQKQLPVYVRRSAGMLCCSCCVAVELPYASHQRLVA